MSCLRMGARPRFVFSLIVACRIGKDDATSVDPIRDRWPFSVCCAGARAHMPLWNADGEFANGESALRCDAWRRFHNRNSRRFIIPPFVAIRPTDPATSRPNKFETSGPIDAIVILLLRVVMKP